MEFVFPKNNEDEFIERAEALDIKALTFVYPTKVKKDFKTKLKVKTAILTNNKNIFKAKKQGTTLIKSSDKNRFTFEKAKPTIVFGLELSSRDDFMHHRNSGLDQVLCKLAKKNNIAIGFPIGEVIQANPLRQAQLMGRMSQNIRFCRKYNVKTILASFTENPWLLRSPHDMASFGTILGMHPKEAKAATNF